MGGAGRGRRERRQRGDGARRAPHLRSERRVPLSQHRQRRGSEADSQRRSDPAPRRRRRSDQKPHLRSRRAREDPRRTSADPTNPVMSATAPGELTATTVIGLIESGAYPRDVVATIARGFLPLAQDDLIGVLAYCAASDDQEIAGYARASLTDIPGRAMFEYASNEQIDPAHLLRLLGITHDNLVIEALIRNRSVSDAAIADLARRADPAVQDVIVINQARIIRAPEILEALLENPALSPDARRRALETKEEFFEKKARLEQLEAEAGEEPELIDVPLDAIADLLERAKEEPADAPPTLVQLTEGEQGDSKKMVLWRRLMFMTIAEKVMVAFRG